MSTLFGLFAFLLTEVHFPGCIFVRQEFYPMFGFRLTRRSSEEILIKSDDM